MAIDNFHNKETDGSVSRVVYISASTENTKPWVPVFEQEEETLKHRILSTVYNWLTNSGEYLHNKYQDTIEYIFKKIDK